MPEYQPEEFRACGVCGRTVLKGERAVDYLTPDGAVEPVCPLCRPGAEDAGWLRADSPEARAKPAPAKRRRTLRRLNLRERAARAGQRVRRPRPVPEDDAAPETPARRPQVRPAEPDGEAGDTGERRLRRAVQRFNRSDQTRVVAGLTRSLGDPRAAVRELGGDRPRLEVTVAWELSWYRWEVGLNDDDAAKQVDKGAEIDELEGDELEWNATVDEEGRLRWRQGS